MRYKLLLSFLLILSSLLLFGCTETTKLEPLVNYCAKCGDVATTSLSGPTDILLKNGIPLSKCKPITSNVYAAYLCDACLGPVATVRPSPY